MGKRDKADAKLREKIEELEAELSTSTSCMKMYHDELIKSKKAYDVLIGTVTPNHTSDLLAELFELRFEREQKLGKETREWLDAFREMYHMKSEGDAIRKLIEIHKAWNMRMGDEFEQWNKDGKKKGHS